MAMATLLATAKMSPELARRVEARVRGQGPGADPFKSGRARAAWIALGRALGVVLVAGTVIAIVRVELQSRAQREAARGDLIAEQGRRANGFVPADREYLGRVEVWLARLAGPYEGDAVSEELRAPGALAALWARPIAYVHGPIAGFANPATIPATASTSFKDALLLCLLAPPPSRAEKVLLGRVFVAYRGGAAIEEETPRARLLEEAFVGWPVVAGPWRSRLLDTTRLTDIEALGRELRQAPVERAVQVTHAALLVAAMDEAGDLGVPTEIDGERPHHVRLNVVDLASARTLLRVRRHVDPSWISAPRRTEYAAGLDQCALAFDVDASVSMSRDDGAK